MLPPSLWENYWVLCQQHQVLSPLSWANSLQTITLQHQELTLNSCYGFLWQFCPSAWSMLYFKICTACFAVHDLGCFIPSCPYLSPELIIQTKARIQAVPVGNLCITDEKPEIFMSLQPWDRSCPSTPQPELMAAWMEASQRNLVQTILSVWLG